MDKIILSWARNDYISVFKQEFEYAMLSNGTSLDKLYDNATLGQYTSSGHPELKKLATSNKTDVFETNNSVDKGNPLIFGVQANKLFSEVALLKKEGDDYRLVGQVKITPQQVNNETAFLVSKITIGVSDSE